MSFYINYQHIVFRTDHSIPTIPDAHKREMLGYIYEVSKGMGVDVLRLNAYRNHVHILVNINPDIKISEYVKTIKGSSSRVFKGHPNFPAFMGWARKYGSLSKSLSDKEKVSNYIKGQEEHHRHKTFREELEDMFGKEFFQDPQNRHDWLDEPMPTKEPTMPQREAVG